ncbi:hypothetical protein [Micromonospora sp. NPDC049679]|uniref:hypothetical protein n=1 Tax=Micromonospora sp. NPDC049679 TaxID=3155920 RepID=UPI0033EA8A16
MALVDAWPIRAIRSARLTPLLARVGLGRAEYELAALTLDEGSAHGQRCAMSADVATAEGREFAVAKAGERGEQD